MAVNFGNIKAIYTVFDAYNQLGEKSAFNEGYKTPKIVVGRQDGPQFSDRGVDLDLRYSLVDCASRERNSSFLAFSVSEMSYPLTRPVNLTRTELVGYKPWWGLGHVWRQREVSVPYTRHEVIGRQSLTFDEMAKRLHVEHLIQQEGNVSFLNFFFYHKLWPQGAYKIGLELYLPKTAFAEMRSEWDFDMFAQYLKYLAENELGTLSDQSYLRDALLNPEQMANRFANGLWFDCKQDVYDEVAVTHPHDLRAFIKNAKPFEGFFR